MGNLGGREVEKRRDLRALGQYLLSMALQPKLLLVGGVASTVPHLDRAIWQNVN